MKFETFENVLLLLKKHAVQSLINNYINFPKYG